MPQQLRHLLIGCVLAALAACSGAQINPANESAAQTTEVMATAAPATPTRQTAALTPIGEITDEGPFSLSIWWPEPLAPLDNETAAEALSEQLSAFQRENPTIQVDFRLKKIEDVGGILSTLRTASAVAPGALPDLTLLRRSDLLVATQSNLVQPLGNQLSPAVLEEMPDIGLALGRVEGQLYGVPYTLDVLHVAYSSGTPIPESWRFTDMLAERVPFVFAAGRTGGINDVLLLQYLAAGGSLAVGSGGQVDADALQSTLEFYEQAMAEGIIDPSVLEYTSPADYQSRLLEPGSGAAVVGSSLYLWLVQQGAALDFAPIPTATGEPTTTLDGWMWVLTTPDADRQARAIGFLNWMLDVDRQAAYARLIARLPSQRTALRQMDDPSYAAFVSELLAGATLPVTESESSAEARAIQSALASVLTGQHNAEDATLAVLDSMAG